MDTVPIGDRIAELEKRLGRAQQRRAILDSEIGELEQDLTALRRVSSRNLLAESDSVEGVDATARAEHGELRRAVEDAISHIQAAVMDDGETFTKAHVLTVLGGRFPDRAFDDSSVSSALRRLAEDGKFIEEVEKGQGRRMTRYRRRGGAT